MPQTDFIPQNPTAFVGWFANFILQLQGLSSKYNVCSEKIAALLKDSEWVHYWSDMKLDTRQREKQLNRFFNVMVNGEVSGGRLTVLVGKASESLSYLPDNAVPGIKDRIREVAECIKSQTDVYTKADGALLGILTLEEAGWIEENYTPEVKFKQLSNYSLDVEFRKYGLDALRFEFRYKDSDWQFGGFLTKSPDTLKIAPRIFGCPEQIEIRAVFWDENRNFGNWSPIYRLVIVP
jgi:hypothetical protein